MTTKYESRNGFTLIELLVVVVIIGILAGIGVAGYNSALDRARNSGVISNTRATMLGCEQWKTDHPGVPSELIGPDHSVAVACDADVVSAVAFPSKYVPGGHLPPAPWSKLFQKANTDQANATARANPNIVDAITGDKNMILTPEGYFVDGFEDTPGGGTIPGPTGPSKRTDYGFMYYAGSSDTGRYAVFGVGKAGNKSRVIALRANFQ